MSSAKIRHLTTRDEKDICKIWYKTNHRQIISGLFNWCWDVWKKKTRLMSKSGGVCFSLVTRWFLMKVNRTDSRRRSQTSGENSSRTDGFTFLKTAKTEERSRFSLTDFLLASSSLLLLFKAFSFKKKKKKKTQHIGGSVKNWVKTSNHAWHAHSVTTHVF